MFKRFTAIAAAAVLLTAGSIPKAQARADSRAYLFGGGTNTYLNQVSFTNGCLTVVCPDYFSINADGSLKLTRQPDPYFIASMHHQGIKVIPFLSNHWDRPSGRACLANMNAMAASLAKMVEDYDLDGVDIDLQNLNHEDRANFTAFVGTLRSKIPASKVVSACVAANPNGWPTGWHGQYDYAALAKSCSYIFIMTYDESWETGPAGPVASYDFIERSIKYALKYTTPDKIMIGVPFYGRYWIAGQSTGGKAFTLADTEALIARYGTKTWYDETAECARGTMVITQAQIDAGLWGGKKLVKGTYDIYYENERSLEKKLSLVKKYGLKGVGSWALGQEPARIWNGYYSWLWGLSYLDMEGHWAAVPVESLTDRGVIAGRPGKLFAPNDWLSKAEACTLLCKMAGFSALSGAAVPEKLKSHWGGGYIGAADEKGILTGLNDRTDNPDRPVTRAEMASMLASLLHVPSTINFQQQPFPDVPVSHWASEAIITLYVHQVVVGRPGGDFAPEDRLTRSEAAQMLYNCIDLPMDLNKAGPENYIEPR